MANAAQGLPAGELAHYAALRAATKDGTEAFQPSGFILGQVVDVYDGDTCRLAIIAPKMGIGDAAGSAEVQYLRIRTLGYDAPEMKLAHRPYGLEVKAVLEGLVLGRIVVAYIPVPKESAAHGYAVPEKADPYGRVLAHLFVAPRGASLPPPRARKAPPSYAAQEITSPSPPTPPGGKGMAALCGKCFPCLWPNRPSPAEARDSPLVGGLPPPAPPLTRATASPFAPPREVVVRGASVQLPGTEDVPCGYGGSFEETARLLWVNGWMIDHARVKPYDGRTAREGYTDEELAKGYPAPPPQGEAEAAEPDAAIRKASNGEDEGVDGAPEMPVDPQRATLGRDLAAQAPPRVEIPSGFQAGRAAREEPTDKEQAGGPAEAPLPREAGREMVKGRVRGCGLAHFRGDYLFRYTLYNRHVSAEPVTK